MSNKLALAFEITADPAKLKAGLAVARRDILQNYAEIKRGVDDANKSLLAAQASAQAMGRNLAKTEQPTRAMVAEFEKARAAVVSAKAAVESKVKALQNARAAAAANATAISAAAEAEKRAGLAAVASKEAAERSAHQRRISRLSQEIAAAKAAASQQAQAVAAVEAANRAAHLQRISRLSQEIAAAKAAASQQALAAEALQRRALLLNIGGGSAVSRSVAAITPAAMGAAVAVARVENNLSGVARAGAAITPIAGQLSRIQSGVIAIGAAGIGVSSIGGLMRVADAYTAVNSRLKVYAESNADLANSQRQVFAISQAYGRDLTGTATLLGRVVQPLRDMGRAGSDAIKITEAVAASLRIAGATTAESTSAQIQFSQAIAANTLQGEELNSVLESSPPLARALALAMRQSVGDLKRMGSEGKLTGQIIVEALLSQYDSLRTRGLAMESLIGESLTRIQNSFTKVLGQRTGTSAVSLANGLSAVADNMNTIVDLSTVAGAAMAAAFGARLISSIFAAVAAKRAIIAAEREQAGAALVTAQSNVRAAQAESARTLTTRNLVTAQLQLAAAEKAATAASAGAVTRLGAGLVGALGGPIGLVTTLLTVGITAWSLWGNRAEAATAQAGKSLAELVNEMQDFGENMSVVEKAKQYEALAAAIAKAREEEAKLRKEALKRAQDDVLSSGIVSKDGVAAAAENDPILAAKVAERRKAENFLQDELTKINKAADEERAFLFKALVEKQKALNGELVIDERKSLENRLKNQRDAANAVRDAWLKSLDLIKQKQDEAAGSADKVADKARSLQDRTNQVKLSGMSDSQRAAELARQANEAKQGAVNSLTSGRADLMAGYSRRLQGDLDGAKKSFDAAEKDLNRAFDLAEKAGDSRLMDEIGGKLVDIEKERGKIAAGEATQAEAEAEAQRAKMNELGTAADELQKKLAGMEVDIKIDAAVAKLKQLYADAAAFQAMLGGGQASSPSPAPDNLPARAYGGPLPGVAPHDRADNMLYLGTPGEWVIQRPAVRYWGPEFMAAINAMRIPRFAFGGELGGSMVSRLRVPSITPAGAGRSSAPDVFDFGALGKVRVSKTGDTAKDVAAVLKRAALGWGNR